MIDWDNVQGTYELLVGACGVYDEEVGPDGDLTYQFAGGTEIFWDAAETICDGDGNEVFLDRNGDTFVVIKGERVDVNVEIKAIVTRKE